MANFSSIIPPELVQLLQDDAARNYSERRIQTEAELKEEMKQLMKMNAWLTKLFMNLLESVEKPDGTKFLSSSPNLVGGQRKKAVLDLINYLLESVGLPACPGPLGEVVYNDLCFPNEYKLN